MAWYPGPDSVTLGNSLIFLSSFLVCKVNNNINTCLAYSTGKMWETNTTQKANWKHNQSQSLTYPYHESCPSLRDWSLPGCSEHGILQVRIAGWVATPSSRGSSWPRDRTSTSWGSSGYSYDFFAAEPLGKPFNTPWWYLYRVHMCLFISSFKYFLTTIVYLNPLDFPSLLTTSGSQHTHN